MNYVVHFSSHTQELFVCLCVFHFFQVLILVYVLSFEKCDYQALLVEPQSQEAKGGVFENVNSHDLKMFKSEVR